MSPSLNRLQDQNERQARMLMERGWLPEAVVHRALASLPKDRELAEELAIRGLISEQQVRSLRGEASDSRGLPTPVAQSPSGPQRRPADHSTLSLQDPPRSGPRSAPGASRPAPLRRAELPHELSEENAKKLNGRIFAGHRIEGLLACGGMGIVVKARPELGGGPVAIKMLLAAPDSPNAERFRREAAALCQIEHPNIVSASKSGVEGDIAYYIMEFIEGYDLDEVLRDPAWRASLSIADFLRIFCPIAEALAWCHKRGIIHRDVKPANLLIETGSRRPYLIDFGVLRRVTSEVSDTDISIEQQRLSVTGEIVGTPAFMSPEQLDPNSEATAASDVWSLAATLYTVLAGSRPFAESDTGSLLAALMTRRAPRLSKLRPDVPQWLDKLCDECLSNDVFSRPTMSTVARRLQEGLRSRSVRPARLLFSFLLTALAVALFSWSARTLSRSRIESRSFAQAQSSEFLTSVLKTLERLDPNEIAALDKDQLARLVVGPTDAASSRLAEALTSLFRFRIGEECVFERPSQENAIELWAYGLSAIKRAQLEDAERTLRRSLALVERAALRIDIARLLVSTNRQEEAIELLNQGLTASKGVGVALINCELLELSAERFGLRKLHERFLTGLTPISSASRAQVARLFSALARSAAPSGFSLAALGPLEHADPLSSRLLLALEARFNKQPRQCLDRLRQALAQSPGPELRVEIVLLLSEQLVELGRGAEALVELKSVAPLFGRAGQARGAELRTQFFLESGSYDEAAAAFEEAARGQVAKPSLLSLRRALVARSLVDFLRAEPPDRLRWAGQRGQVRDKETLEARLSALQGLFAGEPDQTLVHWAAIRDALAGNSQSLCRLLGDDALAPALRRRFEALLVLGAGDSKPMAELFTSARGVFRSMEWEAIASELRFYLFLPIEARAKQLSEELGRIRCLKERLLLLDPFDPKAWTLCRVAERFLGRVEADLAAGYAAYSLDPTDPESWQLYANSLETPLDRARNLEKALRFEEWGARPPELRAALHAELSQAYQLVGDFTRAFRELVAASDALPHELRYLDLALAPELATARDPATVERLRARKERYELGSVRARNALAALQSGDDLKARALVLSVNGEAPGPQLDLTRLLFAEISLRKSLDSNERASSFRALLLAAIREPALAARLAGFAFSLDQNLDFRSPQEATKRKDTALEELAAARILESLRKRNKAELRPAELEPCFLRLFGESRAAWGARWLRAFTLVLAGCPQDAIPDLLILRELNPSHPAWLELRGCTSALLARGFLESSSLEDQRRAQDFIDEAKNLGFSIKAAPWIAIGAPPRLSDSLP